MTSSPARRPARLSLTIVGLFIANGLMIGAYIGALPALRVRFGLSSVGVALVLLAGGTAALVSMQLTGAWAERHGARRPAFGGPLIMVAGLAVLALSPVYPVEVVGAAIFGAGNGMMDVAMNALGVEVEQRLSRVRMGLFHGSWSLGSFTSAMLIVAFGHLSARVWPPVLVSVLLMVLALVTLARGAPESRVAEPAADGRRGRLPATTWLLGLMALCFGFTEGTGTDWSSLHVAAATGVSSSVAALGLACLSGAMVLVRISGDVIVARVGRKRAVMVSAVLAAVGYAIAVTGSGLAVLLLGWVLVGAGVALIAPQIYGLAGHLGGPRMLGVVVGFGYTAFLGCPAIVGATAKSVGLQHAMAIPFVTALVLLALSFWMPHDPSERPGAADAAA